jgi:hypothetical protein
MVRALPWERRREVKRNEETYMLTHFALCFARTKNDNQSPEYQNLLLLCVYLDLCVIAHRGKPPP